MRMPDTTLCYIERDGAYLMLHRVKKENDVNRDKWIGIGGHFEAGESPLDCVRREVWEETGLTLTSPRYRGIVTFVLDGTSEYMHLFTADRFTGELKTDCEEGVLEWVDKRKLPELPLWQGDFLFLDLLARDVPFFSMKLEYSRDGALLSHSTDFTDCPRQKKPLLISACLLGIPCRYDGGTNGLDSDTLVKLAERYTLVPVCPEQLGGLPTPRVPSERIGDRVLNREGADVTKAYRTGAEAALTVAERSGAKTALLKSRSPSCGHGKIYDGSFGKVLRDGDGTTAELLLKHGIKVLGEEDTAQLLEGEDSL